jgi:NADH dehydrogenase
MAPNLAPLFDAVGVRHVAAWVQEIDTAKRKLVVRDLEDKAQTLTYDRFVLASGSRVFKPAIPGLADYAFDVDQLDSAKALDLHLSNLATLPHSQMRNTVVVAGAGFTGIETAAEMPDRMRRVLGLDADVRIVLLEQAPVIGPDLGDLPRPVIVEALTELGIELLTSACVSEVTSEGVITADGRLIPTYTVIWTAGMRANPLAAMIGAGHDRFGRLPTDAYLHAQGAPDVFAAGDVALAAVDKVGNVAAMSCQHALSLGRVAGHNAAAELVGLPLHPYSQPKYVTCIDLGPWGGLYTEGWEREVRLTGAEAKAIKRAINTQWIYPPKAERAAAFETANPDHVIVP